MVVFLDTCALVHLFNPSSDLHRVAKACIELLLMKKEKTNRLCISVLSLSEYAVKGDPMVIMNSKFFRIVPFGERHALQAAEFTKFTLSPDNRDENNTRRIILTDTKIIAQAHIEEADYILTSDTKRFVKTTNALQQLGKLSPKVVLLDEKSVENLGLIDKEDGLEACSHGDSFASQEHYQQGVFNF